MSQPLTDAINALTRYANEVTGASDTTLSDAVGTLCAGYGQGGGSSESGVLTVDSATKNASFTFGFTPTHFCMVAVNDDVPTDNTWKTTGVYMGEIGSLFYVTQAYGPTNRSGASRADNYVSFDTSTNTLTFSVNYNFALTDFFWIAW